MSFDLTEKLTMSQLEALDELKRKVGPEMKPEDRKDDALFLRFLRARNYHIGKAETMLKNHVEWRKKNKIDDVALHPIPEAARYFPLSRIGVDKEGCPIRVFNFGNMDIKGLLKCTTKANCVRTVISYLESDVAELEKESKKRGKHLETWTYIFDFEHYSLGQATHKPSLELITELFMTYEANYPERLKSAFIINASIYFTLVFAVVKPLLTGNTVQKVKIFGKDGYQEEFLEFIDPEVLPAYLGGTRTDPNGDIRCPSVVIPGGLVPKHYYFRSPERRLAYQPGVIKYCISRKSKVDIPVDIDEQGSQIEWQFETENRDIEFALYFQDCEDDKENHRELIPKQRIEAHIQSHSGMYHCDCAGTYILMFDNSYSWLSQKEVYCRTVVIKPCGTKIFIN